MHLRSGNKAGARLERKLFSSLHASEESMSTLRPRLRSRIVSVVGRAWRERPRTCGGETACWHPALRTHAHFRRLSSTMGECSKLVSETLP